MKNNVLKTLALTVTLALLLGCFSVLPVFAEEASASTSEQVSIVAQNLVYADKIRIAYAVDYDAATAQSDVKLAYTVDGGEANLANYWGVEVVNGKEYPVFVTEGFHANEFTKVVNAVAYVGEVVPADASYKTYSVGEYFYTRLYRDDIINPTNSEDEAKKAFYESAIEYGTGAQRVIDKTTGDALLNQYCFVWTAEDGITVNGAKSAFVKSGSAVTLAGSLIGGMTLVKGEGNGAIVNNVYTAEAGVVGQVSSYVEDPYVTTDYEAGVPYSDYAKTYDADGNLVENVSWTNGGSTSSTAGLDVDPKAAANHVLHVRTSANGTNFTTKVSLSNENQVGNCYTFETKVYAVGFGNATHIFANLRFVNEKGTSAFDANFVTINNADSAKTASIVANGSSSNLVTDADTATTLFDYNNKQFKAAEWHTVRVEFYYAGGNGVSGDAAIEAARNGSYLKVYVDNVLAFDGNAHWVVTSDIDHVELTHTAAKNAQNLMYDDISFTRTNKPYVAGNEYAD